MFVAFEKHANHSHLLICILLNKHNLLIQVEEALKILMAYCSLGEEYQVDYLLKRIKHWLHLRRIKKFDGNTSQVYVEKAVPSGLDSVWKKRSVIFFALIFILIATIACLLFLSASDIIPVLGVVVFHLCTVNNQQCLSLNTMCEKRDGHGRRVYIFRLGD